MVAAIVVLIIVVIAVAIVCIKGRFEKPDRPNVMYSKAPTNGTYGPRTDCSGASNGHPTVSLEGTGIHYSRNTDDRQAVPRSPCQNTDHLSQISTNLVAQSVSEMDFSLPPTLDLKEDSAR